MTFAKRGSACGDTAEKWKPNKRRMNNHSLPELARFLTLARLGKIQNSSAFNYYGLNAIYKVKIIPTIR